LVSAVIAWGLFIGIGVSGLATIVLATRGAYRRLRRRGLSHWSAVVVAVGVGLVLGLGGWLLVALHRLSRRGSRLVRTTVHSA
jgi:hypothetical protein